MLIALRKRRAANFENKWGEASTLLDCQRQRWMDQPEDGSLFDEDNKNQPKKISFYSQDKLITFFYPR